MTFGEETLPLMVVSAGAMVDQLGNASPTCYQTGIYTNAVLGTTWEDLVSTDFSNLGTASGSGPVACAAGLDFAEIAIWNSSSNTVYFILRTHYVGPGPAFTPEDPTLYAFPVLPGGVVVKEVSMVDSGLAVHAISVIASAAGSSVRINANFQNRT